MKISKSKTYNHIGLNDVKAHLRINQDFVDDDSYLKMLIKTASRIAEEYIGDDIALTTTTIEDYDVSDYQYVIHTPNILAISGITGDSTVITGYSLFNYFNYSVLEFNDNAGNNSSIDVDDLRIIYTSGYSTETIDDNMKHAILVKIAELYDVDRSGYVNNSIKYTRTFESLLDTYKILI